MSLWRLIITLVIKYKCLMIKCFYADHIGGKNITLTWWLNNLILKLHIKVSKIYTGSTNSKYILMYLLNFSVLSPNSFFSSSRLLTKNVNFYVRNNKIFSCKYKVFFFLEIKASKEICWNLQIEICKKFEICLNMKGVSFYLLFTFQY